LVKSATTFAIAAIAFLCIAAAPPVTFESSCECRVNHGKARLAIKTDSSTPPADASAIQVVTPSEIFNWPGPDVHLTGQSERTGIENKWFALTGRVVTLKVEQDGDLHIALADATGDKPGIVVVEVPEKPQWCEIRNMVFSWTRTRFPFHTSSAKKLNVTNPPIITVIGKAFSTLGILLKINLRTGERIFPATLHWEIHPVMKIDRRKNPDPAHARGIQPRSDFRY
jgi:hypothetical protein